MLTLKLAVLALVAWEFIARHTPHWKNSNANIGVRWICAPWLLLAGAVSGRNASFGLVLVSPLHVLGQRPRWSETLRAYFIGHLGKYVPGKALVVIFRTSLIRSHRRRHGRGRGEHLLRNADHDGGRRVRGRGYPGYLDHGQGTCRIYPAGPGTGRSGRAADVATGLSLAGEAISHWQSQPASGRKVGHLNYGLLAAGWLAMAGGWVLVGSACGPILVGSGYAEPRLVPDEISICVATAALAVVAGFLSMLPGGVGVREAVLLELLEPQFGSAGSMVAAVVARLVWLVSELVISGILYRRK